MSNRPPKNICLICDRAIIFNFKLKGWSWWATRCDGRIVGAVHDDCANPRLQD
ncbi:MAG: hypothetical protein HWQ38_08060 [Nostoc sp. NMS7]|uniref:hypothetical protein n=1 Tax=Nostoc sp. NMS7 TaxID=2815391 RepID=UPI0025F2349A|nr:hypothetical protein [Nostoc sp. NMS7]MBN3946436.1 hypothetical protein [Nostoc sp. NMS7]